MATDMIARAIAMGKADLVDGKVPASELPDISIDSLSDTAVEEPENGEVLKWDAEQRKWVNGTSDAYTKAETDELLDGKADIVDGKVPAAQLPSYVDDVVEYASFANFPAVGESGKIYLALDMNRTYRWSGSEYIPIPDYNIWKGTRAQYEALLTDDYDLYFITEGASS